MARASKLVGGVMNKLFRSDNCFSLRCAAHCPLGRVIPYVWAVSHRSSKVTRSTRSRYLITPGLRGVLDDGLVAQAETQEVKRKHAIPFFHKSRDVVAPVVNARTKAVNQNQCRLGFQCTCEGTRMHAGEASDTAARFIAEGLA